MKTVEHCLSLLRGPSLGGNARHTYVRHLSHVVIIAVALGILANAPAVAVRTANASDWHVTLNLVLSGFGLLLVLYLGRVMATRRKMRFAFWPGLGYAACSAAMVVVARQPFVFMFLSGMGVLFETISRPAITAIMRTNYSPEKRAHVAATLRRWSAAVFLVSSLGCARLLDRARDSSGMMKGQLLLASALSLIAFLIFRTIRVAEKPPQSPHSETIAAAFAGSLRILASDARFRRYLLGSLLYCFGALMFSAFYTPFFAKDLGLSYVNISLLIHVFPSTIAFFTTVPWGRYFDRAGVWKAWAWIRTGWGLDPIIVALAILVGVVWKPGVLILPFVGRGLQGIVKDASWVLWWQIGVTQFAPPGGDTTRYTGILMFMNGVARILAPLAGAWLISGLSRVWVFYIGGMIVLASAAHCFWEARRERGQTRYASAADFEQSFESRTGL